MTYEYIYLMINQYARLIYQLYHTQTMCIAFFVVGYIESNCACATCQHVSGVDFNLANRRSPGSRPLLALVQAFISCHRYHTIIAYSKYLGMGKCFVNILKLRRNGHYCADDIFKCILVNEMV